MTTSTAAPYRRVLEELAPGAASFAALLDDPAEAQRRALAGVWRAIAGARRTRRLGATGAAPSPRDLADAFPIVTYDDLREDIDAIAAGEAGVLTAEPVVRFEHSGGSSGAEKLVPMTASFLAELSRALSPWLHDMFGARPRACDGPAYWVISPIARGARATTGGVEVGTQDDASYFPPAVQQLVRQVLAVPGEVALYPDVDACRYATLRLLLEHEDLAFLSAWSPTFLTLLFAALDQHAERLLDDLATGRCRPPALADDPVSGRLPLRACPTRARALREVLRTTGGLPPTEVFARLALVSVWADASSRSFAAQLAARLPGVELQPKGLLATEGVVTLPYGGAPAPVLATASHFYEFIDVEAPAARPLLAHELCADGRYEVLVTTGAGLVRYRLGDVVEVAGFLGRTPCLRFTGRASAVSDLVGEKLSAAFVERALDDVIRDATTVSFRMLAPVSPERAEAPRYRLYLQMRGDVAGVRDVARRLDDALRASPPYDYARALGQLGPLDVMRVTDGGRRYEEACVHVGQRPGSVKPCALHRAATWDATFGGEVVSP